MIFLCRKCGTLMEDKSSIVSQCAMPPGLTYYKGFGGDCVNCQKKKKDHFGSLRSCVWWNGEEFCCRCAKNHKGWTGYGAHACRQCRTREQRAVEIAERNAEHGVDRDQGAMLGQAQTIPPLPRASFEDPAASGSSADGSDGDSPAAPDPNANAVDSSWGTPPHDSASRESRPTYAPLAELSSLPTAVSDVSNCDREKFDNWVEEPTASLESIKLTAEKECKICMAEERAFALIPCGHLCVCATCVRHLKRCPICRTEHTGTLRIYS